MNRLLLLVITLSSLVAACGNESLTSPSSIASVDLKVNNSDGPVTVNGDPINLKWTSNETTACTFLGPTGEGGVSRSGSDRIDVNNSWYPKPGQSVTFTIRCRCNDGIQLSDSVTVRRN